jgi:repressor LexA
MSGILAIVRGLTKTQQKVVDYFQERARAGEGPPTYRELCRHFGWRSTATARDHLKPLVEKGALLRGDRRWRGVRLAATPHAPASIPFLGEIVAGRPSPAEAIAEEIDVPTWLSRGECFALRVRGLSMLNAGVHDGDIAVIQKTENARPRQIVAVTVNGETTLKRLVREGNQLVLKAENPDFPPIALVEDTVIHGVLIGLLRKY